MESGFKPKNAVSSKAGTLSTVTTILPDTQNRTGFKGKETFTKKYGLMKQMLREGTHLALSTLMFTQNSLKPRKS